MNSRYSCTLQHFFDGVLMWRLALAHSLCVRGLHCPPISLAIRTTRRMRIDTEHGKACFFTALARQVTMDDEHSASHASFGLTIPTPALHKLHS
jgi:hypothetical protein